MTTLLEGANLSLFQRDHACVELRFDAAQGSANIFNRQTSQDLSNALDYLEAKQADIAGLLVTSAKSGFIAGADINEFGPVFNQGPEKVAEMLNSSNRNFNRLEDLAMPTVVAINGYALGGGCEFCLACDYRIGSQSTRIGLPETRLGIIPGWGGTVRLPRIVGIETAIEWMSGGKHNTGADALKAGVLDGLIDDEKQLVDAAWLTLKKCIDGELNYRQKRQQKQQALAHNDVELTMAITTSRGYVGAQAGRHYPAPLKVVDVIHQAAACDRQAALAIETEAFVELAQTPQATALSGIFVNDQLIAKKAKDLEKSADKTVARGAVLGAGIMGGGIAYQSALKGIPIKMKDITQSGLDLGLEEASALLTKRVERGRMTPAAMAQVLTKIESTLHYADFESVDLVVEAVVENPKVKQSVLSEVEQEVTDDTVIATNTSTISVNFLAESLKRPENFCGMHFFNPVHAMPLVEVIRGEKTSDNAVARTVAYASAMGKKAIVVRDCPGFLVNRVLFPYLAGFSLLLRDGADFQQIDKVMEAWGWPMGPAYLMDVIGIDTCIHAEKVMADGFPERMRRDYVSAPQALFDAGHYGQKTEKGFYSYTKDKRGKSVQAISDDSLALIESSAVGKASFTDEEIMARMLIPMATELARCLEEEIVASAGEADMALIYGLGFPPFRGGLFRWLDTIGMHTFQSMLAPYSHLGSLYQLTTGMEQQLASGSLYYPLLNKLLLTDNGE